MSRLKKLDAYPKVSPGPFLHDALSSPSVAQPSTAMAWPDHHAVCCALRGRCQHLHCQVNEDFFNRTAGGGVITLISSLIMATLFLSELRECWAAHHAITDAAPCTTVQQITVSPVQQMWAFVGQVTQQAWPAAPAGLFLRMQTVHELSVDTSRGEKLDIHVSSPPGPPACLRLQAFAGRLLVPSDIASLGNALLHAAQCCTLLLQFDITFHNMPCGWMSLDAMDVSGESHLDLVRPAVLLLSPCELAGRQQGDASCCIWCWLNTPHTALMSTRHAAHCAGAVLLCFVLHLVLA